MSLINQMQLQNIIHDESSSVDIGANWVDDDMCHIAFRFNEDGEEDIEFHMLLGRENLLVLQEFINQKLIEQTKH